MSNIGWIKIDENTPRPEDITSCWVFMDGRVTEATFSEALPDDDPKFSIPDSWVFDGGPSRNFTEATFYAVIVQPNPPVVAKCTKCEWFDTVDRARAANYSDPKPYLCPECYSLCEREPKR